MLLLVDKVTKGRMCHAIHCYAKANNNYMKYYDPGMELGYRTFMDGQFYKSCQWIVSIGEKASFDLTRK